MPNPSGLNDQRLHAEGHYHDYRTCSIFTFTFTRLLLQQSAGSLSLVLILSKDVKKNENAKKGKNPLTSKRQKLIKISVWQ